MAPIEQRSKRIVGLGGGLCSESLLKGNWPSVMLPIGADEQIDFTKLAAQIDTLVGAGVDGIYTNGSAGEFYAQSELEFDRIQKMVAERCHAAGQPFIIGASHMSAQVSLERIQRSRDYNPLAFQVILPDWFPPSYDEVLVFLRCMAAAADPVGLILYNPPHAKKQLDPQALGRLQNDVPQLVGVKLADGDSQWYAEMREHCQNLALFVPGHHLATGISQGAAGSFSNVAALSPVGAQCWVELMKTDLDAALSIEVRIRQFMAENIEPFIVEQGFTNTAADKLLAAIGGWSDIGTRLRWPYRSIDPKEAERLRPIAIKQIPELFVSDGSLTRNEMVKKEGPEDEVY